MQKIYNEITAKIESKRVLVNEPMKNHTTFKVGGPADIFVKVGTLEELECVLQIAKEQNVPITIIGNGSNVLVTDKGIRGIVIKLDFKEYKLEDNIFTTGAGVLLPKLARIAQDNELTGLEFACGIPASLGGAIYMNSGAYGEQISDKILQVTFIDENLLVRTIKKQEVGFDYRKSIFQEKNWIIISAKLQLEKGNKQEISKKMEEYLTSRKDKQPLNMPSAGSVFKRGENYISAKLIDECGLKGYSIGGAEISTKHAGFIVNKGNATAKDILDLIDVVKQKVEEKTNKDLELEIRVLGEE